MIFLLLACHPATDSAADSGTTAGAPDLPLPDLTGVDLPSSFQDAMADTVALTLSHPFDGNRTVLTTLARDGCPDLYVGSPPEADYDAQASWMDHCRTAGGLFFAGDLGWEGTYSATGSADDPAGLTVDASRSLSGAGSVGDNDSTFLNFDGQGQEALYRVDAPGATHWTWSSLVQGTVGGDDTQSVEGGWRSDLYLYASGGDVDHLELRGNVYFPEHRIQNRFDSVAMDLAMDGTLGAQAGTCTAEPAGWIGLRDENAYWYDLVFGPRNPDGTQNCDGCGILYLRGVEAPTELATVCVDFSGIYAKLAPPDPQTFVLTLHQLETP